MAERTDAGLAPLLETVQEEARRQAEQVLADARVQSDQRLREAERSAAEIEARAAAAGTAEGDREARRRVALARIESRRELLRVRETYLDRAIDRAVHDLDVQLQGPAGTALVAGAVRAAARALGEGRVYVRAGRIDRDAVEAALRAGGPEIAWADATPDETSAAGVLVLSADRHRMVDMTVDGIARRRRDALRRAAAKALAAGRQP